MTPTRGVLVHEADIGRYSLPPDSHVWILGARGESCDVEYRDARGTLPSSYVVESPVARPTAQQLQRLEACFGLPRSAFSDVHVDAENCFAIQRCRAHGLLFLRDTRGTIGLYERLTLLHPDESEDWNTVWSRYHQMSDDWLNLQGRTW